MGAGTTTSRDSTPASPTPPDLRRPLRSPAGRAGSPGFSHRSRPLHRRGGALGGQALIGNTPDRPAGIGVKGERGRIARVGRNGHPVRAVGIEAMDRRFGLRLDAQLSDKPPRERARFRSFPQRCSMLTRPCSTPLGAARRVEGPLIWSSAGVTPANGASLARAANRGSTRALIEAGGTLARPDCRPLNQRPLACIFAPDPGVSAYSWNGQSLFHLLLMSYEIWQNCPALMLRASPYPRSPPSRPR